jgi:hypothetical protein
VEALEPLLAPGQTYTIGYFATSLAPNDRMLHTNGSHELHALLNQIGGGFVTDAPAGQLMMPNTSFQGFEQWIGPSFIFAAVPGPGAMALFSITPVLARRSRRRNA